MREAHHHLHTNLAVITACLENYWAVMANRSSNFNVNSFFTADKIKQSASETRSHRSTTCEWKSTKTIIFLNYPVARGGGPSTASHFGGFKIQVQVRSSHVHGHRALRCHNDIPTTTHANRVRLQLNSGLTVKPYWLSRNKPDGCCASVDGSHPPFKGSHVAKRVL